MQYHLKSFVLLGPYQSGVAQKCKPNAFYFIIISFFSFSLDVLVKLHPLITFCSTRISVSCCVVCISELLQTDVSNCSDIKPDVEYNDWCWYIVYGYLISYNKRHIVTSIILKLGIVIRFIDIFIFLCSASSNYY